MVLYIQKGERRPGKTFYEAQMLVDPVGEDGNRVSGLKGIDSRGFLNLIIEDPRKFSEHNIEEFSIKGMAVDLYLSMEGNEILKSRHPYTIPREGYYADTINENLIECYNGDIDPHADLVEIRSSMVGKNLNPLITAIVSADYSKDTENDHDFLVSILPYENLDMLKLALVKVGPNENFRK